VAVGGGLQLPAGEWQIDPKHSPVEFAVRHLMVATVKGRFARLEGRINIDPAQPERSSVEVSIDAASIDTHEAQRDTHLRSADFLDAENHPQLTYRSTSVRPLGEGRFQVDGELTIRGVTRPVTLDAEALGVNRSPYGFQVAGFSATTRINRKDFGLNWNMALEAGGVLVGDEVKISLEIEAIHQAPQG
jgi:polyisoprenoid-binding protein YceI